MLIEYSPVMFENMDKYKIYIGPTKNKQYNDNYKNRIRYYLYVDNVFLKILSVEVIAVAQI